MTSILQDLKRTDLAAMAAWIDPGASVLDLGCGDGALLEYLKAAKGCRVQGVDIDPANILACAERGIPVVQRDLNGSLLGFEDGSWNYVIVSQTIHQVKHPDQLIGELLRIGDKAIVSFPNFGHWRLRLALVLGGRMPKGGLLPYEWYETPNIHVLTLRDFEDFCAQRGVVIRQCVHIVGDNFRESVPMPNLLSEGSVMLLEKP